MNIKNTSNRNIYHIIEMLENFYSFAKKRMEFDRDPEIRFISDKENSSKVLGNTAYYDPAAFSVTVYVDNRHPKDIMRSLSHELIHHKQNCEGRLDMSRDMSAGYAQEDEYLREIEKEAFLEGNMCFRDWEDGYKKNSVLKERKERLYYRLTKKFI